MEERKAISLSGELHLLMRVTETLRRITEGLCETRFHDTELASAIAGCMTILKERLRLLDRAIRGAIDPRLLWCEENDAITLNPSTTGDDGDVVLKVWSDRQAARHHRKAWKTAKRRLKKSRTGG
jgi:hypothetical protein